MTANPAAAKVAAPVPPCAIAKVPAVMADAFIVPLCVKVAPEGIVMVSPDAPNVMSVPVLGSIAFTFIKLILSPKLIPKELSPFLRM